MSQCVVARHLHNLFALPLLNISNHQSRFCKRNILKGTLGPDQSRHVIIAASINHSAGNTRNEVEIIKRLEENEPNTVRNIYQPVTLLAYSIERSNFQFHILEFESEPMNLVEVLRNMVKNSDCAVDYRVRFCLGILEAVQHCHKNGILLRGLTAASFVVKQSGSNPRIQLFNFEHARYIEDKALVVTGKCFFNCVFFNIYKHVYNLL